MLDGAALRFGALFGSEKYQRLGPQVIDSGPMYLSICSGEAPCFKVICRGQSLAKVGRLQTSGGTNVVHCRHLEVLGCIEGTEGSADIG